MPTQHRHRLAGSHIPHPRQPVGAGCRETESVRAEGRPADGRKVPREDAACLAVRRAPVRSRRDMPQPHRRVVSGRREQAVATERGPVDLVGVPREQGSRPRHGDLHVSCVQVPDTSHSGRGEGGLRDVSTDHGQEPAGRVEGDRVQRDLLSGIGPEFVIQRALDPEYAYDPVAASRGHQVAFRAEDCK